MWDSRQCPDKRGVLISEVLNREVSLYYTNASIRKIGMEYISSYQNKNTTRVVRIVTKVKGRFYFYLSSVFGCLAIY